MDKKTLIDIKILLAAADKSAEKKTLADKIDKGISLVTKAVALAALIATLLSDVATKLLPALEILLKQWPRPGPLIGADSSA